MCGKYKRDFLDFLGHISGKLEQQQRVIEKDFFP